MDSQYNSIFYLLLLKPCVFSIYLEKFNKPVVNDYKCFIRYTVGLLIHLFGLSAISSKIYILVKRISHCRCSASSPLVLMYSRPLQCCSRLQPEHVAMPLLCYLEFSHFFYMTDKLHTEQLILLPKFFLSLLGIKKAFGFTRCIWSSSQSLR